MTLACLTSLDDFELPPSENPAPTWLSTEELERFHRFTALPRRHQFLCGRWLLRQLCSRFSNPAPETWRLTGYGPPRPISPRKDLWLSLSHSGRYLFAAASDAGPVGVDVEHALRPRDHRAMAERVFAPEEVQAVSAASDSERAGVFYRLWTAKEALFKAGFAEGLYAALGTRLSALRLNAWNFSQAPVFGTLLSAPGETPELLGPSGSSFAEAEAYP